MIIGRFNNMGNKKVRRNNEIERLRNKGLTQKEIAKRLDLAQPTISEICQYLKRTGRIKK